MERKTDLGVWALWARCFAALAIDAVRVWVTNTYLYPQYVALFPIARDLSSLTAIATLVVLALWVQRRPSALNESFFSAAALVMVTAGFCLVALGLWQESPVMLCAGTVVRAVGNRWFIVLLGVALCQLGGRSCMLCIAAALAAGYVARIPLASMGFEGALLFLLAEPVVMLALCRRAALTTIESMKGAAPSVETSITQPASFVPFAHGLFVAIFLFRIAYGFALTFESVSGVPQQTMLGLIPLGLVTLLALVPHLPKADVLYQAAALLVCAGFLSVIVLLGRTAAYAAITNGLLFAGSECFEALVWFVLASIGSRNKVNALAVFAWGRAASSAGLLCGAVVGHGANALADPFVEAVLVAAVLLAFVAVNLTVFKGLSFQDTIDGVRPVETLRLADGAGAVGPDAAALGALGTAPVGGESAGIAAGEVVSGDVSLGADTPGEGARGGNGSGSFAPATLTREEASAVVAKRCRLTPRETEILGLLAHGRNAPYIQEKLVLSRNTVKTHVQNIYAKLGVHSQQELIDLVEDAKRGEPTR